MNEGPLPFFAPGSDPGSSFVDLLRRVSPDPATGGGSGSGTAPFEITHGTTVVAIRYADGVVMAGDRRATSGFTIASRRIEKVFPADDFSGVAIAGAAGPAVEMVRLFQVQLEHYEKIEGEPLSLEGKANQLAQMVRANLPAAMQGFVVVPLFAGYDERRGLGRVFSYDADRRQVRRGRLPDQRLRGSPRSQLDQGGVARGDDARRGGRPRARARSSPPPTRTPRPAAPTSSGGSSRPSRSSDATGYRAVDDTEIEQRAQALLGGREEGAGL